MIKMSLEETKQLAWKFVDEIFNNGNINEADKFVTPDFIYHARGEDIEGLEKFKEWFSSDTGIFSDIRITLVDSLAEYGKVATAWIVEGTHEKEYSGIPATHKKFETVGISIFHFEDNKIKELWTVTDALTPALDLGIVKPVSYENK
ncbi:MAG TPA: ester cyclase [Nitrososphaeraceae archaeon]|nr:ester cyclase [Nitrososphaeraceae archaeon]